MIVVVLIVTEAMSVTYMDSGTFAVVGGDTEITLDRCDAQGGRADVGGTSCCELNLALRQR